MVKDFDGWNTYKKKLDIQQRAVYFDVREIWLCSIGINIGSEQDSYSPDFARPIIIIKKFTERTFWAIPLTTKLKGNEDGIVISLRGIQNEILPWHLRSMDSKRLIRKVATLSDSQFEILITKLISTLEIKSKTP